MATVPDDVDISGMPAPPSELTAPDADISTMPTPADLFKQHVGRDPESDQELETFKSHPESFAGYEGDTNTEGKAHAKKVAKIAARHPFTAMTGLAENALSGVTGGVGNLVDAVTMSEPGTHDYTYQPRTEAGKEFAEAGGEESGKVGQSYDTAFGTGPLAQTIKERGQEALGAVSTAVPTLEGAGAMGRFAGSGARAAGTISDFGGGNTSAAPAVDPTVATPPVEGPVTGASLRAQPDPLAQPAPAAAAAPPADTPPAAPAASGTSVRVPGKPHIRPKVPATAAPAGEPVTEPVTAPPAAASVAEAPEPIRFTSPTAEGASVGEQSPEQQASRLQTVHKLNELAGGQLGEVRTSALSGNSGETGTDWAHAKVQDAGGKRMQEVIGNETNTLRAAADNLVERTGTVTDGVDQPALNRRGTVISNAISGIEKWFDDNIKSMYTTAKERARGIPIQDMSSLKAFAGDKSQFYGTVEGEALHRGVQARAQALGLMGEDGAFKPATIEQAEQFRQYLGTQWTPRTADLINKLKDVTDEDVTRHGGADLFNRARSLRSQKGKMLEDPTGIAKLLHPDDRLGINRDVPLNEVPDYIANLDPQQFNHVVNVLKSAAHLGGGELAEPAAAAIREIKGHMAAKLHDAGSSKIQGGWDAKSFYKQLNDYSLKMPSIFGSKELGDWKTVNDASNILRMDRTYKGAKVEEHNIGLGASMRAKAGTLARGAVDVGAHHALPVIGPALAETTGISEKVGRWIGGDPEKLAEAKRLAHVEGRITKLNASENEPTGDNAPTLGQNINGARQRGGPKFENNASGESSASLEAQSRVAQEKAAGQHRYMLDPDGNVTPLTGVDSVDRKAPAGHVIIQRGIGNQPYSVLDRGGMNAREAQGLVARAQGLGKLKEVEQASLGQQIGGGNQRGGPKTNQLKPGGYGRHERKEVGYGRNREVLPAQSDESLVNIGLHIGDKKGLTPEQVTKVLEANGVKVKKTSVHSSNSEPTMVATLDRPLTPEQAHRVSGLLKQDAIAQVAGGKGELYGPKAEDWKPFNRDYFLTHKGQFLSDDDSLHFKHYGDAPGKAGEPIMLDPDKYGQGLKGAERTRVAAGAPKVVSAYGPAGEVEPELRNKPQFSIKARKGDMYDLSADPKNIKQSVMDDNNGVYDHTEVEHAIKDAGYKGYYLPNGEGIFKGQARFFNKTQAVRVTPDAPSEQPLGARLFGGKQRGAVGNLSKKPGLPTEHLTTDEKAQLRKDTTQKLIDAFHKDLPPTEEYAAAALAGKAKKGWYENSARAIANVFGPDSPRFSALLAAMSPQTSVQMNFHSALRTFINWDKAGRPTDPAKITQIMRDSVPKSSEDSGGILHAWVPNSIRALSDPEPEKLTLSGPKVNSFMHNLRDNVHEVTNDAWMSSFAKIDPVRLKGSLTQSGPGKSATYMAMSAKVRAAAKMLSHMTGDSWTPREVQETVWSWAKIASEHADSYGALATIPELVKDGEITDDLIKASPDFHQLFTSPEHSGVIASSRFAGNAERMAGAQSGGTVPGSSGKKAKAAERALQPHLQTAAKRLEEVRQERATEGDQELYANRRSALVRARDRLRAQEQE